MEPGDPEPLRQVAEGHVRTVAPLADVRNEPRWNDQVSRSELVSSGSIAKGSRFKTVNRGYEYDAVITTYEVVMRYVFGNPTQWAFEMVMVLCASAWMISVGYITRHRRHIGITVLYILAPKKVRFALDLNVVHVGGTIGIMVLASATFAAIATGWTLLLEEQGLAAADVAQVAPQRAPAGRVEAGRRLVEEQHVWPVHEAAHDLELAHHAA